MSKSNLVEFTKIRIFRRIMTVKKQKIAWGLREEPEWLEHFTAEQAAARTLRRKIEKPAGRRLGC